MENLTFDVLTSDKSFVWQLGSFDLLSIPFYSTVHIYVIKALDSFGHDIFCPKVKPYLYINILCINESNLGDIQYN